LTVYKGKSLLLGDLIVRPENSLMQQSRDAGYHPGVDGTQEVGKRNIRVNGDGFGVAWYRYDAPPLPAVTPADTAAGAAGRNSGKIGSFGSGLITTAATAATAVVPTSHCFKFITPAWSNANLRSLGNGTCV
jgi:hypothetical protein